MTFIFRVASKPGLGHVMRMKWLAHELRQRDQNCVFLLCEDADYLQPILDDYVSDIHFLPKFSDEQADAESCLAILARYESVDSVIVDHPRLGSEWEAQILNSGFHVTAFDDTAREHKANFVFDQKWQGQETSERYRNKIPASSRAFLGPDYCLLGPDYRKTPRKRKQKRTTLMLSLGGGGNLASIVGLIENLFCFPEAKALQLNVVVGPQAESQDKLLELDRQHENLELVRGKSNLYDVYKKADLFVGALGTSLYELAATATPSITFAIAEDQLNRNADLNDLGQYFYLPDYSQVESMEFAQLVITASEQIDRMNTLCKTARIEIDGLGAERVANILMEPNADTIDSGVSVSLRERQPDNLCLFTPELAIRKVKDSDIHSYLEARNRRNNADQFTVTRDIPLLEHFNWWLRNQRDSYVLTNEGEPELFLWQQTYSSLGVDYFYGGWFTAKDDVPFNVPMIALRWQLNESKRAKPKGHWVAVIHKENRFVNLLNQYMGFTPIANPSVLSITQQLFPQADQESFNFVELSLSSFTGEAP